MQYWNQDISLIRTFFLGPKSVHMTLHSLSSMQILQPPKLAPNQARLIVTSESTLKFGKELGSGAFGTVFEVMHSMFMQYWEAEKPLLLTFTKIAGVNADLYS